MSHSLMNLGAGWRRLILLSITGLAFVSAHAEMSPRDYTRFTFTPTETVVGDGLDVDHVDVFVALGKFRAPRFMRSSYRVHARHEWSPADVEAREMTYSSLPEYEAQVAAVNQQLDQFAKMIQQDVPRPRRLQLTTGLMFAVSWFTNFESTMRGVAAGESRRFVNSEVTIIMPETAFKLAASEFQVMLQVRHFSWDAREWGPIHLAERIERGRARRETLGPEDTSAIANLLKLHYCGQALN